MSERTPEPRGANGGGEHNQDLESSIEPPAVEGIQPFILAGGRSSRFGSDKAEAEVAGIRQIDRLAAMLRGHFPRPAVLLCSETTAAKYPGHERLVDEAGSRGPASGLAAALTHLCSTDDVPWALLVPCDLFAWSPELTEAFLSGWRSPADAVAVSTGDHLSPLPSLWHRRRARFARLLAVSENRSIARAIANDPLAQTLVRDDLAPHLRSFNTPEELEKLAAAMSDR